MDTGRPKAAVRLHNANVERPAGRFRLLVTAAYSDPQMRSTFGKEAYSYRIVARAFQPLLERWAEVVEVDEPEKNLADVAARAAADGVQPVHVSFLPPQFMTILDGVPNVGVPAWEFPDVPATDLGGQPRHNWVDRTGRMNAVITHTGFSRDAFVRAGIRTPVHLVPVPIAPGYLTVPPWDPRQTVTIDCPCYDFRPDPEHDEGSDLTPDTDTSADADDDSAGGVIGVYRRAIKPRLPGAVAWGVNATRRAAIATRRARLPRFRKAPLPPPFPVTPTLELSGVVYTTILNHVDGRKNWPDILTGFVTAMKDCPDATLVVKLITRPENERAAVCDVAGYYRRIGIPHRCRVVFVTEYLDDQRMIDLARASTFYLNASKAEGSCLPLQDYLAAGRPAIAPTHTGMGDVHDPSVGFVLETHAEPVCYPHDPDWRIVTTWQRLVWPSLVSRLRESYRVATSQRSQLRRMARTASERMARHASRDAVWPRLDAALLDAVTGPAGGTGDPRRAELRLRRAA